MDYSKKIAMGAAMAILLVILGWLIYEPSQPSQPIPEQGVIEKPFDSINYKTIERKLFKN